MESDLNDKEDNFIETSETLAWTTNPLYRNNNIVQSDYAEFSKPLTTILNIDNHVNFPRINIEFETESGYSETVSLYSVPSSPELSLTSNTSYSDEEVDLLSEITKEMLKSDFMTTTDSGKETSLNNENAAQIISSKGTVRGVRNRVRDNILHFCSAQTTANNSDDNVKANDPEQGKVLIYTTSLGLIRSTQDDCRYVRRIFHNLMVKFDEKDLFVHPCFKMELQNRLEGETLTLPKVFVNGTLIGGAKEVEGLIETGKMQDLLQQVERVSHSKACPTCGGYRFINCVRCSGSGKSRRTRISREINRLKCSSCTNGIVACPECNS